MLARLVSHSECSTAVLELARGERLLASLLGAVPAEAARLSSLSDRALSADGVLVEPLCTQLHAVGFGLKMSAACLLRMINPTGPQHQSAGASVRDVVSVVDALLAPSRGAGDAYSRPSPATTADTFESLANQPPVAVESAAESPLGATIRNLCAIATKIRDAPPPALRCAPRTVRWRGNSPLHLVDVAALHAQLCAAGSGNSDAAQLDAAHLGAQLAEAARYNRHQEVLSAVCNSLEGCRQVTLLLSVACNVHPEDADTAAPVSFANRLALLREILKLLHAPQGARLAPTLVACALSLLEGLGARRTITEAPHLLRLALDALDALARATASRPGTACRRDLYLVLLRLLTLARSAQARAGRDAQHFDLRRQMIAALRGTAGGGTVLLSQLADDAGGELGATERCVSFALIDTLLHFEHGVAAMPPAGLNPSSGSAWLLSLFEKLADPTSLLSRALCELLGGLPPTQDAVGLAERVNALNVYESMTALLLHVVNEASRGSVAAWHGLFSSGVLHHLSASPFLDLQPTYLDAVDAGADASSLPGHEVHARLLLPALRAMCAVHLGSCGSSHDRLAADLLAHFLAGTEARRDAMLLVLRSPSRAQRPLLLQHVHMIKLLGAQLNFLWRAHETALHEHGGASASRRFLEAVLALLPALGALLPADRASAALGEMPPPLPAAAEAAFTLAPFGLKQMEEEREEMAVHDVELHEALEEAVEQLLSICAQVCCPALREAPAVPPHAPAGTLAAAGARSSRTLFAPTLAVEASAVLGAAPSLGVVRHLIAYAVAQLRHAEHRYATYAALGADLSNLTREKLRWLARKLAGTLPAAQGGRKMGSELSGSSLQAELVAPPLQLTQSQLIADADALLSAWLTRCRRRAALYLGLLEKGMLLLAAHTEEARAALAPADAPLGEFKGLIHEALGLCERRGATAELGTEKMQLVRLLASTLLVALE